LVREFIISPRKYSFPIRTEGNTGYQRCSGVTAERGDLFPTCQIPHFCASIPTGGGQAYAIRASSKTPASLSWPAPKAVASKSDRLVLVLANAQVNVRDQRLENRPSWRRDRLVRVCPGGHRHGDLL
jgi:hypothetical protein